VPRRALERFGVNSLKRSALCLSDWRVALLDSGYEAVAFPNFDGVGDRQSFSLYEGGQVISCGMDAHENRNT
jgi:hypothetical protein